MCSADIPLSRQPVSAVWGERVARQANRIAIGSIGSCLVRDGGGMMAISPLPANNRNRIKYSDPDIGCFRIILKETSDGESYYDLDNCYILAGEKFRELEFSNTLASVLEGPLNRPQNQDNFEVYICVCFNCDEAPHDPNLHTEDVCYIRGFASLEEINNFRREKPNMQTIPVYLLSIPPMKSDYSKPSKKFSIKCDFRIGVFSQQMEIFP